MKNFRSLDDRISELVERPDLSDEVTAAITETSDMDRRYRDELRAVRRRSRLSQQEVAARMRTNQGSISRIENGSDTRISTLLAYLDAIGAEHPRLRFDHNGEPVEVDLAP